MPTSPQRVAVGFPGQGINPVVLARTLTELGDHELVRLALRLAPGQTEWSAKAFGDTRVAQPAIVAAGLALAEQRDFGDRATIAVGHSLGEITALAFAGALSPVDAVELAAVRADLGHRSQLTVDGAMAVMLKLEGAQVASIRTDALAEAGGVLEIGVNNGPLQTVLSGSRQTCEAAVRLGAEAGGVTRLLGIGGAYHSTLMEPAAETFVGAVDECDIDDPRMPVAMSTDDVVFNDRAGIRDHLASALVRTADWPRTLANVWRLGFTHAVEPGPSDTLTKLGPHCGKLTWSAS